MFNTRYYSFASLSQWRAANVHHQGAKGKFDLDRPQVNMAVMAMMVNMAVIVNMAVMVMAVMTVMVAVMLIWCQCAS